MKVFKTASRFVSASLLFTSGVAFSASVQASVEPTKRGNYYVCPGGGAVATEIWKGYNNSITHRPTWKEIISIEGEILVGKKSDSYPKGEIKRLTQKIMEGVNVPTSYKLQRVLKDHDVRWGYESHPDPYYVKHHTYEFVNSQGKNLSLTVHRGMSAHIKDSKGKIIETNGFYGLDGGNYGLSRMKCVDNAIVVREVEDFSLRAITNQYGEKVELPIMFMIREVKIKTKKPSSQSEYSF